MRTDLQPEAIKLRKRGYLYSEISKELGVSKSTAHAWTSGIALDENQFNRLSLRLKRKQQAQVKKLAVINRGLRIERNLTIEYAAKEFMSSTKLDTDTKRLMCAIMFWCEGGKDVASGIQFINSDPLMVKAFLSLLREVFPIKEDKFRALIHLHEYHDPDRQLQFWSDITNIPKHQFYNPYLKPHTGNNIREGYQGCISVRYGDSSLGKLLKMLYIEFGNTI